MSKNVTAIRAELARLSVKYQWERFLSSAPLSATNNANPTPPPSTPIGLKPLRGSIPKSESCDQRKRFKQQRTSLAAELFVKLNRIVFDEKLPSELPIRWSRRLNKTAGITRFTAASKTCVVELSEKVIDRMERLQTTLLHECCHVAVFLLPSGDIDDDMNNGVIARQSPHGKAFKFWAAIAEERLGIEGGGKVTTCHNYEIHTPHKFGCTNASCGKTYGRHSKKGIDTDK